MQNEDLKIGPIGKGWVTEVKTKSGTRFVARWNAYILREGRRVKVTHGPYELGILDKHCPDGLRSLTQARGKWKALYRQVFEQNYPASFLQRDRRNPYSRTNLRPHSPVGDLIGEWERLRKDEWEDNSRINWEYLRDSFLAPFFGSNTVVEMNHEDHILSLMTEIAKRRLSIHVAKKVFSYVTSLLDLAVNLGVIRGNAARTLPKKKRFPKGIVRSKSQPAVSTGQFVALLDQIRTPRDRLILRILFFCALRRSELFVLKWKDLRIGQDQLPYFEIQRSFCSQTHKVKDWEEDDPITEEPEHDTGKQTCKAAVRMKAHGKVAIPPGLHAELEAWGEHGTSDRDNPESYIFPTQKGTCIIPTNWAEDILKRAGERAGIPDISYHWFRRGHATVQHHKSIADKPIQAQMRHSKAEVTRNIYIQHVGAEQYRAVTHLEEHVQGIMSLKDAVA